MQKRMNTVLKCLEKAIIPLKARVNNTHLDHEVMEENMINLNILYKLIKSEEQRLDKYVETYSQQRRSRHDL